jgi:hypothetical protein
MNLSWKYIKEKSNSSQSVYTIKINTLIYLLIVKDDEKILSIANKDYSKRALVIKYNSFYNLLFDLPEKNSYNNWILPDDVRLYSKIQELNIPVDPDVWEDFYKIKKGDI